jgi:hypothetical protein
MYLRAQQKRLGQDETGVLSTPGMPDLSFATQPVSISPLMLGGIGLLALAYVLSGARRAGGAVSRKARAVRKALRA